jgi:hypothetical protein
MVPVELPAEVLEFLDRFIDSIPELETLLIMSDDPQRHWTAAMVAQRIYVSPGVAHSILESLLRRRFISAGEEGCRFAPPDEAHRALVARVATTYRSNLVSVANFIHKKAPVSVMEFARAFDLKKKDH